MSDDGPDTTERNRLDILAIATSEFADKGFDGARVDEIAARTQTSKRMLYYHFGGKLGLYRAVLALAYDGIRSAEIAADLGSLAPMDALLRLTELTFDYHFEHPDFVRLVMNENMQHGANISGSVTGGNGIMLGKLRDLIDRGIANGAFRPGLDAIQLHMTMSALAFYNVSNRYTVRENFAVDLAAAPEMTRRRREVVEIIRRYCRRD